MPSLIRRTTLLVGTLAVLSVACSSAPEPEAGPISRPSTSETVGTDTVASQETASTEAGAPDTAFGAPETTVDATVEGSQESSTTIAPNSTTAGKATTTTARSGSAAPTTTLRVTTTTVKPRSTDGGLGAGCAVNVRGRCGRALGSAGLGAW